jgi:transposase-like protein
VEALFEGPAASDAHSGLKAAVASGLVRQRCKAHFLRSALSEAPKAQWGPAAAMAGLHLRRAGGQ